MPYCNRCAYHSYYSGRPGNYSQFCRAFHSVVPDEDINCPSYQDIEYSETNYTRYKPPAVSLSNLPSRVVQAIKDSGGDTSDIMHLQLRTRSTKAKKVLSFSFAVRGRFVSRVTERAFRDHYKGAPVKCSNLKRAYNLDCFTVEVTLSRAQQLKNKRGGFKKPKLKPGKESTKTTLSWNASTSLSASLNNTSDYVNIQMMRGGELLSGLMAGGGLSSESPEEYYRRMQGRELPIAYSGGSGGGSSTPLEGASANGGGSIDLRTGVMGVDLSSSSLMVSGRDYNRVFHVDPRAFRGYPSIRVPNGNQVRIASGVPNSSPSESTPEDTVDF